jgi:hypothetical protein
MSTRRDEDETGEGGRHNPVEAVTSSDVDRRLGTMLEEREFGSVRLRLWRLLRHWHCPDPRAWEIASDTMSQGWLRFGPTVVQSQRWPWLACVARHLFQRKFRARHALAADSVLEAIAAGDDSAATACMLKELRRLVWQRLSAVDRATAGLLEAGFGVAAIAERLAMSRRGAYASIARVKAEFVTLLSVE